MLASQKKQILQDFHLISYHPSSNHIPLSTLIENARLVAIAAIGPWRDIQLVGGEQFVGAKQRAHRASPRLLGQR